MLNILSTKSDVTPDEVAISLIRTDGETQMRAKLNQETIDTYAEKMREGVSFPPVELYYDGDQYWIGDGFHRIAAHRLAHGDSRPVNANVRAGGRRKAILHAVGANDDHGLPRTNADKRRAVLNLLTDDEWAKWSDGAIAQACKVTQPFVSKVRRELSQNGFEMPTERVVHRGGATYTQETGNVGGSKAARRQPSPPPTPAACVEPRPPAAPPIAAPGRWVPAEPPTEPAPAPQDRRVEAATNILHHIEALWADMEVYGGLTGKYTHIPPAKRALEPMRMELESLIEVLSEGGKCGQ